MQNNDLNTQGDTPREKCAWCRCKIKLIDSIKEKGDKNYTTGNYGFTEAERKVLTEIKEWVKNMPEEAPPGGLTSEEYEKLSSLGFQRQELDKLDLNEALNKLEDLIKAYERGQACALKGKWGQAISEYNKVIKIAPRNATFYRMRGLSHAQLRNFDQAISDHAQAISIDPRDAEAHYFRGIVYGQKGIDDRAISDYTQAISIDPLYSKAYTKRGLVYLNQNKFDQAISDYIQAININPHDPEAYWGQGLVYVLQNKLDQAISYYNKAITIDPQFGQAYYSRAIVYCHTKDFNKAWNDVYKAQECGAEISSDFLNDLKKASTEPRNPDDNKNIAR